MPANEEEFNMFIANTAGKYEVMRGLYRMRGTDLLMHLEDEGFNINHTKDIDLERAGKSLSDFENEYRCLLLNKNTGYGPLEQRKSDVIVIGGHSNVTLSKLDGTTSKATPRNLMLCLYLFPHEKDGTRVLEISVPGQRNLCWDLEMDLETRLWYTVTDRYTLNLYISKGNFVNDYELNIRMQSHEDMFFVPKN